jgi:Zn-dependent protease/CBS domain-containing protein
MARGSIGLGKLVGIPIRVDLSWLFIVVWVTWSLASGYFPARYPEWPETLSWGMGMLSSALFFGSVLLHEMGHSLVARAQRLPVTDITLFIFGGASQIAEEPRNAREELLLAGAGPATSLGLAAAFGLTHLAVRSLSEPLGAVALFLAGINLSLGLFNLIPGYPLDGGRVLRAILWGARRDVRWAARWASRTGRAVAGLFVLFGIYQASTGDWVSGLWVLFIGFFLDGASRSSYQQLTLRQLLEGHVAAEIMAEDCQVIPPQLSVDTFVEHYLVGEGVRRCYVVGTRDELVGLLTPGDLQKVPRDRWMTTRVREVAMPVERLRVVAPDTPLWTALLQLTAEGVNQMPVLDRGQLVGMISRDRLLSLIRRLSELDP